MKRSILLCSAALLLLLLLTAPPTLAAPMAACYITPSPGAIATALANPSCLYINLAPGIYKEHGLAITRDVVIHGAGKTTTIVDGELGGRVFDAGDATTTVVMSGMTIRNGSDLAGYGGAIKARGKLFLSDMIFLNNKADVGGAVEVEGPATNILRSTFKGNTAVSDGGAVAAYYAGTAATIDASIFDSNKAGDDGGAVTSSSGAGVDISRSTFKNNQAADRGGAVHLNGPALIERSTFTLNSAGSGGAIFDDNATVTVRTSTFTSNKATVYDGGAITHSQNNLTLSTNTFTGNTAFRYGGAIYSVNSGPSLIEQSSFTLNRAGSGGAIFDDNVEMTVRTSKFSGNKATAWDGGAITHAQNNLTLSTNTFAGNTAVRYGGALYAFTGGGIAVLHSTFNLNRAAFGGAVNVQDIAAAFTNSTFSANTATDKGGGIYSNGVGLRAISFVTLSGNRAPVGGSIYSASGGAWQVVLKNTILNAGSVGNCAGAVPDAFVSFGGNISSDDSCNDWLGLVGDLNGPNPRLGLLANYGGKTKTHSLLLGSPAINHAVDCMDVFGSNISVDQRFLPRPKPVGGKCDSGAFEK